MSQLSDHYRRRAAKARSDANGSALPNVKLPHSHSADRLDEMVQRLDSVAYANLETMSRRKRLCCAKSGARDQISANLARSVDNLFLLDHDVRQANHEKFHRHGVFDMKPHR